MNRIELINFLIRQRAWTRYLEISMHQETENFAHIRCARKVYLPVSTSDVSVIYEDFFSDNTEAFDLIFIDGIHTEEAVLKDIGNACRSLAAEGIIVLHDCMPPDQWHQRDIGLFKERESWNGTVWKAALRVFNQSTYKCWLLNTDWGCGIIDTAQRQCPARRDLPDELIYELHYNWFLEYKVSVAEYLQGQVKVFYHLACMGNWQQVFAEQMQQLQQSGFTKINLTILGTGDDLLFVQSTCSMFHIEPAILFHCPEFTHYETPALLAIQEYARHNEGFVLYLHSKGVSNPGDQDKVKWRQLMMRELIEKWEYCMQQLPYYEIIGVNWRDMPPVSHFCGNFWYASTQYLRKLPDFKNYYDYPRYQITNPTYDKRFGCEFWISSCPEMPHLLSLFCRNVDFCNTAYWKNNQ